MKKVTSNQEAIQMENELGGIAEMFLRRSIELEQQEKAAQEKVEEENKGNQPNQ